MKKALLLLCPVCVYLVEFDIWYEPNKIVQRLSDPECVILSIEGAIGQHSASPPQPQRPINHNYPRAPVESPVYQHPPDLNDPFQIWRKQQPRSLSGFAQKWTQTQIIFLPPLSHFATLTHIHSCLTWNTYLIGQLRWEHNGSFNSFLLIMSDSKSLILLFKSTHVIGKSAQKLRTSKRVCPGGRRAAD